MNSLVVHGKNIEATMRKETGKLIFFNFLCFVFYLLDRIIKNLSFFKKDFLFFKFSENYHLFFFFKNNFYILIFLLFLLFFLIVKSYKNKEYTKVFFLTLIVTGGISNFLDRIIYGFVIDCFNFLSLFSFNLSDIIISLGSILFLIKLFKSKI